MREMGVPFVNKNGLSTDPNHNMKKSQNYFARWKDPGLHDYMLYIPVI